ncbi:hypothetical protein LAZ67_10001053 [Cordylochernes scorpioides]|uniref:ABC-2 type transporter transmembrane domain-containing protein n=1 Tax=Cordylochernes scorpioides TaxID=51811 RepID=A0ABY6KVJ2_9ARAC|nr:hypothetical protein LAZ67_10001053 [Cordylochernes scorpioides]
MGETAADIRTYVDTGKKTIYTKIGRAGRARQDRKWATGFGTQLTVLARRNFQEARKRVLSRLNWMQTIGLGLVAGLLWFQLERTESHIKDIRGWMFFSSTYWMLFTMFGALVSFPTEREVINKERSAGMYRSQPTTWPKMTGELPLIVTLPSVFHFISYPLMGCQGLATFLGLWAFQLPLLTRR